MSPRDPHALLAAARPRGLLHRWPAARRWSAGIGMLAASGGAPLGAQEPRAPVPVTVAGRGPQTYVLLSGLVGGVAGFRRLEARLLEQGHRVVAIDPYHLSIDSADVTFAALARRVDAVLDREGVVSARVVGHAHGAGVALRLAASMPERVSALYFLDVGAQAANRSPVFSASLRLVPLITRLPGGRSFVRRRLIRGLRQSSGRLEWLDPVTQRAYTDPVVYGIDRVVALALRLARAREPEPLTAVVARIRVPVTVILGDAPHIAGPEPAELTALEPLDSLVRIEHLPGVGHFPHEEAPDEVTRILSVSRGAILARWTRGAR